MRHDEGKKAESLGLEKNKIGDRIKIKSKKNLKNKKSKNYGDDKAGG